MKALAPGGTMPFRKWNRAAWLRPGLFYLHCTGSAVGTQRPPEEETGGKGSTLSLASQREDPSLSFP